jgi:hypothetical protein
VLALDVDLCTPAATRVRFEADFRRAKQRMSYHGWRGSRQGAECTRIFLGMRQKAERLAPGDMEGAAEGPPRRPAQDRDQRLAALRGAVAIGDRAS